METVKVFKALWKLWLNTKLISRHPLFVICKRYQISKRLRIDFYYFSFLRILTRLASCCIYLGTGSIER